MKKTYINPTIKVVQIKTNRILMLSLAGTTNETNGNLGREFDLEDEE